MVEVRHDVYAEGAAIAHGASAEIADLVSPNARDRFKRAFHETLVSWLLHDKENREGIQKMIRTIEAGLERDETPEETRFDVEKIARRLGYL